MNSDQEEEYWYKSAIFYEISIKAFKDGNNDGIGDFKGILQKLDYLKELGINCIWLLPFYPSPWKDDGYDVSDYLDIHPVFGIMQDFEELVQNAHERNIRIITDLVINHTSDQHEWFKESRSSINSPKRNYYVWSETDQKFLGTRIIFQDVEDSNWTLDKITNQYYWHRFYSSQPDLNFDSIEVQQEMINIYEFWLDKGLDGFRVDAVPYLFQRDGTSCESLPETHEYINKIRFYIDQKYGKNEKILLAEANQTPEDTIPYFGNGTDEFHMGFNFPLMPRLFYSLAIKDPTPIKEILEKTEMIPKESQWCIFLRNHDELTLEMVTEDIRKFMWNYYAPDPRMKLNLGIRRRLAPLLNNNRKKIELMNSLLFSLPGSPIIYYGDEIGMGDNINLSDRNGVRTPMQWANTLNAGFSDVNERSLYLPVIIDEDYGYHKINVASQEKDKDSLLHWFKLIIKLRKNHQALSMGDLKFLKVNNRGVLCFVRRYKSEELLLIHSLLDIEVNIKITIETKIPKQLKSLFNNEIILITDTDYLEINLQPFAYKWFLTS